MTSTQVQAVDDVTATTLVIVNPASASGRTRDRWPAIVERLRAEGVDAQAVLTQAPGHATDIARAFAARGGQSIIILGGDGTVGETVAGLVRADGSGMVAEGVTIAIIHQGTGGDFARGLGIPRSSDEAVIVAARGATRVVDVPVASMQSLAGDELVIRGFANLANIGMGADVVKQVTGRLKKIGNSAAFLVSALHQLMRNRPRPVHVMGNDHDVRLDIVDVMVANNRYMGGGMMPAPLAELDDGLLDVVMITAAPRLRLARKMPKLYKGTHLNDPITRWFRTGDIRVDTPADAPQGVVLDGELAGRTPASFHVIGQALGVRVP